MMNCYVATLVALLVGAAAAPGQVQDARLSVLPEALPVPPANGTPVLPSGPVSLPVPNVPDQSGYAFPQEHSRDGWCVFTVDAEYILAFLANSRNSVPLATSAPLSQAGASVLGSLSNADHGSNDTYSGGRLRLGYWLIEDNPWVQGGIRDLGVEATFFFLGQRSLGFNLENSPNLVRSFFDADNRQESGFVVAAPGEAIGTIHAQAKLTNLLGAELNVWDSLYRNYPGTTCGLSVLGGFRFLNADYQLQIASNSSYNANLAPTDPLFPLGLAGNTLAVTDNFTAHNRFYGGQIGVSGKAWIVPWLTLEAQLKVALGVTNEEVTITGSQVRTFANGQTQTYPAGVLALPSNSGHFGQNHFAQAPEAVFKLSAPLTEHLTITGGFSALYWSRIARAAEQVDRAVNVLQIPNFPVPAGTPTPLGPSSVSIRQADLWVLGITLGAEIVW
jgi:hypothetical protein